MGTEDGTARPAGSGAGDCGAAARTVPVVVLGGNGYVAGEALRLLAGHPVFRVAAVASTSRAGTPVVAAFPHLRGALDPDLAFRDESDLPALFRAGEPVGVLAATPHGATAALLDRVLSNAEAAGADVRAVDLSADFRFADAARYQAVYGHPHGAPARIPQFTCAVPEHFAGAPVLHATQPGCFTTAVTMAAWPFFRAGLVGDDVFAAAVTGSSGSGRTPSEGTHHPERHGDLRAYGWLAHRHEPEMAMLLGAARDGVEPDVAFVPHSGPFVRGIHATVRMTLKAPASAAEMAAVAAQAYAGAPLVHVGTTPPRLVEVVGTNRCVLGIATRGRTLVVASVIDNLAKGAAGGGIQWMNRQFGLSDACGLGLGGPGWF